MKLEILKKLAEELLDHEYNDRDGAGFWFSTHTTESAAKKKVFQLNFVLIGSGAKAVYERDTNYMGNGYGVYIKNFTEKSAKKLINKYKIEE